MNYLIAKRLMDILGAGGGLILIFPIIVIIAIFIKISSKGPVFYRGIRTGLNGVYFRIFKFRTMVMNAEERGGPTTGTNDPRVTKIGAFLRRTKLDELPQLINVLLGDMSLVGPRPEVPLYTQQYVGEEKLILTVRPGITDYSSIEFADLDDLVGTSDPDEYFRVNILPRKNMLRQKYVKEMSFLTDIKIITRTIARVWKRIVKK